MSTYSDLLKFFDETVLTVDAQNFAFGIDMNHRSNIKRHAAIRPDDLLPSDLSITLAVYLADPTQLASYREIKGSEMFQFIRNLGFDITLKEFGLLFGREQSSGHRWVTLGDSARPTVQRAWATIMNSVMPEDLILALAETAGITLARFPTGHELGVEDERAA
jgi:hypothetical protein